MKIATLTMLFSTLLSAALANKGFKASSATGSPFNQVIQPRMASCPTSAECTQTTNNCTGHGVCTNQTGCYACTCSTIRLAEGVPIPGWSGPVLYVGSQCELEDISVIVSISVGVVILLFLAVVSAVGLLSAAAQAGPVASGGKLKRD